MNNKPNETLTSFDGREVKDQKLESSVYFEDGTWKFVARYVNDNYTIQYKIESGFQTEQEALKKKKANDQKYRQEINKIKDFTDMRYTFFEYLLHWEHVMVYMYSSRSIQARYHWIIHKLIIPHTDHDILLGMAIPSYFNSIIAACRPECQSAGAQVSELIRMVLKDAMAEQLVSERLIDGITIIPRNNPKMQLLNKKQLREFLREAKKTSCYLEILLAVFCGIRSGEVLGLKFSDFDEQTRSVSIRRQYSDQYQYYTCDGQYFRTETKIQEFKPPKTETSYRKVVVPGIVWDALMKRKDNNERFFREHPQYTREFLEYVCIGTAGHIKSCSTLLTAVHRCCSNAGVPKLTFHALRHIFATICLENGCPLSELSAALGHARESLTFEIYCGIVDANEQAMEVMDKTMNPVNFLGGGRK